MHYLPKFFKRASGERAPLVIVLGLFIKIRCTKDLQVLKCLGDFKGMCPVNVARPNIARTTPWSCEQKKETMELSADRRRSVSDAGTGG